MSFFKRKQRARALENIDAMRSFYIDDNKDFISSEVAHAYWWDDTINFGDLIGPWLISLITNKTVVNSKYLNVDRTTFTVGSIIEHASIFPNKKISIWGSGLIEPLNNSKKIKKLSNSQIDNIWAVRGLLTKNELSKIYDINHDLPLGDPALLLPKFFSPCLKLKQGISIVPHFSHKKLFEAYKNDFNVIDVMQSPQNVVSEIASSKVCISTSLHGIIIAQAYNVPWLLLRVEDEMLLGDMFKFDDFFSTLEGDKFPIRSVLTNNIHSLNIEKLANDASLTAVKINLDDLLNSFSLS